MKIEIKTSRNDEDDKVIITNEGYNNLNFVSLCTKEDEFEFELAELYFALKTFIDKRDYMENKYED